MFSEAYFGSVSAELIEKCQLCLAVVKIDLGFGSSGGS